MWSQSMVLVTPAAPVPVDRHPVCPGLTPHLELPMAQEKLRLALAPDATPYAGLAVRYAVDLITRMLTTVRKTSSALTSRMLPTRRMS